MSVKVPEEGRLEFLVGKAAGVHVVMAELHAISQSMRHVGFTDDESKDRSLQQRVRRRWRKLCSESAQTDCLKPAPLSSVQGHSDCSSVSISELSTPPGFRISGSSCTSISSSKWNTCKESPSIEGCGVDLSSKFASPAGTTEDRSVNAASTEMIKPPPRKKTQRTPHQVQESNAVKLREERNEKDSMKIITTMVQENRSRYPNPRDKRRVSIAQACRVVNAS